MCNLGICGHLPGTTRAQLNEDVDWKFADGDTPLMLAVKAGNEEVVDFMLRTWLADIDFTDRNSRGEMVHHVAPNARIAVMLQEAEEKQDVGEQEDDEDENEEDGLW